MKVISRRANECVIIDEETQITVLAVYHDHVRLAISSPSHSPSFWEQDLYVNQSKLESPHPWWWHGRLPARLLRFVR
ncbi:MAG: carbon storage regulator [Planctomycetes bacterium]|nr:carbon storage regulator [Planctomycetota bacterium]